MIIQIPLITLTAIKFINCQSDMIMKNLIIALFVLCLGTSATAQELWNLSSLQIAAPTLTKSTSSITGLNSTAGTAGSVQSFVITFSNTVGTILLTATSPIEVSVDGGST